MLDRQLGCQALTERACTHHDVGRAGTQRSLVHNLDLVVQGPDGAFEYGNQQTDADGAQVVDDINNVEQVTIPAPWAGGAHRVYIIARDLPLGAQKYSLVVTGRISEPEECAEPTCTDECNGNGLCKFGTCSCFFGFEGEACETLTPPILDPAQCQNPVVVPDSPFSGSVPPAPVVTSAGPIRLR